MIFNMPQEEYEREGIDVDLVSYEDNRPRLDTFLNVCNMHTCKHTCANTHTHNYYDVTTLETNGYAGTAGRREQISKGNRQILSWYSKNSTHHEYNYIY